MESTQYIKQFIIVGQATNNGNMQATNNGEYLMTVRFCIET